MKSFVKRLSGAGADDVLLVFLISFARPNFHSVSDFDWKYSRRSKM